MVIVFHMPCMALVKNLVNTVIEYFCFDSLKHIHTEPVALHAVGNCPDFHSLQYKSLA